MKKEKKIVFAGLLLLMILLMATGALAANVGWKQKGKKIYYYKESVTNPEKTVKAKGLQKIGKKYFYFSSSGVLQTGWISTEDGYRYFNPSGSLGKKGAMYTGLKTIGKYKYYFGKNGVVTVGYKEIKGNSYFFYGGKKLGIRGRALRSKWKSVGGKTYYFGADGIQVKNAWVKNQYYVGADGQILKNTVTPDGYLVDADGKKVGNTTVNGWVKINGKWHYYQKSKKKLLTSTWKTISGKRYYFDADGVRATGWKNIGKYRYRFNNKGVMQTGWQTISGKTYYFDTKGRMLKNTTLDGYIIGANGVAQKDPSTLPKILVIAGHGQGDVGASSSWGYERDYTRQLSQLIVKELKSSGKAEVTYYKDGSILYDCYQQNVKTLGSAGLKLSGKITGKGTVREKVLEGIKTNPNLPLFTEYDYVLEVHFNAMGSGKNPQGDGKYTGVGFYINSYKSNYALEKKIISSIVKLGFKQWGSGVFASSTLFNARVCQELGVNYGLLETAFIDDGDDMKFYTKNKQKIAKAIAAELIAGVK